MHVLEPEAGEAVEGMRSTSANASDPIEVRGIAIVCVLDVVGAFHMGLNAWAHGTTFSTGPQTRIYSEKSRQLCTQEVRFPRGMHMPARG